MKLIDPPIVPPSEAHLLALDPHTPSTAPTAGSGAVQAAQVAVLAGGGRARSREVDDLDAGRGRDLSPGAPGGRVEAEVAMFRSVVDAALGMGTERGSGCGPDCVLGCGGAGRSQIFGAVPDQVAAVREFVRLALAGHPAADDAVAVASELAANSVAHNGSGFAGGMFTVHVVALGEAAVGLAVTELRGDDFPEVGEAGSDAESGLGLTVVRALTSLFWVSDAGEIRTLLATIPAPSVAGGPARVGAANFGRIGDKPASSPGQHLDQCCADRGEAAGRYRRVLVHQNHQCAALDELNFLGGDRTRHAFPRLR